MRLISLLILSALLLISCGKKTDPIPKSKLADLTPPAAISYKVTDEGILIENQENENLIIEKGIPEGDECTFFNRVTMIGPKATYLDTEVEPDHKYFYRLMKKTVKYGLVSAPYVFSLTYEQPLKIANADYLKTPTGYNVSIETDAIFMRFDVYSGGKSIAQTGGKMADILQSDVVDNQITLVLTDYYGNKGILYPIQIPVERALNLPQEVAVISVLNFGNMRRIAWSHSENADSYTIEVCEGVSCETFNTVNNSLVYQKPIDTCITVTATAVNADGRSKPATYKYCRPIEE
ncbi:MAG: hypothetical protein AB7E96_05390 [Deferribacterales bacterium]